MHRTGEEPLSFGGVVAAEIDRFAHFVDTVLQATACFVSNELHQRVVMRLKRVSHGSQNARTFRAAECVPAFERIARSGDRVSRRERGLGRGAFARQWRIKRVAIGFDRQIAAGRVAAAGAVELRRLRQARVTARTRFQCRDRISGDEIGRDIVIEERMHERRVGAVLQQTPNEIRQQIFVAADRRINTHRQLRLSGSVKRLAHAVQALELKIGAASARGHAANGGDGVRIVRRELREDRAGLQQIARAGEIVDIRRGFGGPDREVGAAHDLRALHFTVPVRTFDQTRLNASATAARERGQHLDQLARALLISLDRKTQAFPALQRRLKREALKQAHRHDEAVRLFSIERQADVPLLGALREL